ncbi:MAG: hypothetical protein KDD63_29375, partial [Bacteroidetes bacterium]|nr:hypothetical protein [Bacteroidota bacterium]
IGALLGTTVITGIGESFGWNFGFILAGFVMLVSALLPILSKEQIEIEQQADAGKLSANQRFFNVIFGILAGSFFWVLYEVISIGNFEIQTNILQTIPMEIPKSIWFTLGSFFSFPLLIVAIILWTLFYQNQFVKLTIGFLSGAFSIGILLLIPEASNGMSIIMYLISVLLLNIAEVHIGPIISSIITQYANPKYLAIVMSLVFVPTRLLMVLVGFFSENWEKSPSLGLVIGTIGMGILGLGIFVYQKKEV